MAHHTRSTRSLRRQSARVSIAPDALVTEPASQPPQSTGTESISGTLTHSGSENGASSSNRPASTDAATRNISPGLQAPVAEPRPPPASSPANVAPTQPSTENSELVPGADLLQSAPEVSATALPDTNSNENNTAVTDSLVPVPPEFPAASDARRIRGFTEQQKATLLYLRFVKNVHLNRAWADIHADLCNRWGFTVEQIKVPFPFCRKQDACSGDDPRRGFEITRQKASRRRAWANCSKWNLKWMLLVLT